MAAPNRRKILYRAWKAVSDHASRLEGVEDDIANELHGTADRLAVKMEAASRPAKKTNPQQELSL